MSARLGLAFLFVCCINIAGTYAFAALPGSVNKVLKKYGLPASALSVVVQGVRSKTPSVSHNAGTARNPASTIKLVTTWTALDVLGPAHTFKTEIYALGPIKDGVLEGDLLLKGYGDPYLVLEEIWKMLGELRQTGLSEIRGDLVIDDSVHTLEPNNPGEFDGGTHRLYNVIPTALTLNFNATRFLFNALPGDPARAIRTIPELPNLQITDRLKRTNVSCRSKNIGVRMQVESSTAVRFSGKLPRSCSDYELSRSVMDSTDYALGTFKSVWSQWGGIISGGVRRGVVPKSAKPLITWESRALAEMLRPVNKWSNNVMSRLLLYAIASAYKAYPVSKAEGANLARSHLQKRGLDVSKLVIDNGSGLSRTATVTASFMNGLLIKGWHHPHMPEFISSMSISGMDGTMRTRFKKGAQRGRMHLKTGLLRDVISIAGYVHAKSGRVMAVTMLLNHRKARNGSGRALQDAVLKWAYAQ